MNFSSLCFLSIISYLANATTNTSYCADDSVKNNCIQFSVASGTGCQWMCNYCEQSLGTTNYYFTDGVCTYQSSGCTGNPQVGVTYTCCTI